MKTKKYNLKTSAVQMNEWKEKKMELNNNAGE